MGRLFKIIKGWWLRLLGRAEKANPRALLEAEVADFHKATASYNENLAKQAGMIERLKAQITSEEKKSEVLKARAAAAYSAKLMDKAGQMALQLKETQRDLDENKSQLTQAEALYKNLVRQRDVYLKEAKARIDVIKSKISKAEMAEAQAQLTEVANATAFSMGGAGASLGRLEEALDDRIANAAGKVRVATDSAASNPDFVVTEAEQNALEAQALAEFAAQMGLQAPAGQAAPAPAVSRDLGPELPDPALDPLKVPEG